MRPQPGHVTPSGGARHDDFRPRGRRSKTPLPVEGLSAVIIVPDRWVYDGKNSLKPSNCESLKACSKHLVTRRHELHRHPVDTVDVFNPYTSFHDCTSFSSEPPACFPTPPYPPHPETGLSKEALKCDCKAVCAMNSLCHFILKKD